MNGIQKEIILTYSGNLTSTPWLFSPLPSNYTIYVIIMMMMMIIIIIIMSRRFGEEKNLFPISENETIFFHPQLAPLSFY